MTREHFDAIATRYDALRGQLFDAALELLVREADLPGRRVLDLGCGTGRFAVALAERHGCTVFGTLIVSLWIGTNGWAAWAASAPASSVAAASIPATIELRTTSSSKLYSAVKVYK